MKLPGIHNLPALQAKRKRNDCWDMHLHQGEAWESGIFEAVALPAHHKGLGKPSMKIGKFGTLPQRVTNFVEGFPIYRNFKGLVVGQAPCAPNSNGR